MKMALRDVVPMEPKLYHGIPTMEMHVDDPIPTPRAPVRYAVRVSPDLARYLLTFNHERNRRPRPGMTKRYASDMRAGLWRFTPASVVFSTEGVLQDGQNRLTAVTEYGEPIWLMMDFGWPSDIIHAIDRGASRSTGDALKIEGITYPLVISAAVARVACYEATVGTWRGWSGLTPPSAGQVLAIFQSDPEGWEQAAATGTRLYDTLDKGLSPTMWATASRVIVTARPDEGPEFFQAIHDGSGEPGSPSRRLADLYRRRPATATKTGDSREPIENIIRAFSAHRLGKSVTFVSHSGFTLSRVK